jgi:hypothetical protein
VQKTTWSDGTEVICNFGEDVYEAKVKGKTYKLPQFGYVVKGPEIEASITLLDGKRTTIIKMKNYEFSES